MKTWYLVPAKMDNLLIDPLSWLRRGSHGSSRGLFELIWAWTTRNLGQSVILNKIYAPWNQKTNIIFFDDFCYLVPATMDDLLIDPLPCPRPGSQGSSGGLFELIWAWTTRNLGQSVIPNKIYAPWNQKTISLFFYENLISCTSKNGWSSDRPPLLTPSGVPWVK